MNMRDVIRKAAVKGFRAKDIKGLDINSLRQAISEMCQKGELHKAILARDHVAYFNTPEKAREYQRTTKAEPKRHVIHYKRQIAPKWDENTPAVITAKTIYTVAPAPQRPTHTNTHSPY